MSGTYDEGADFGELSGEQRDALGQLHGRMTRDIAEAHATGDKPRAERLLGHRRMVSGGLWGDAGEDSGHEQDYGERHALEERRAALTRELHEAVAGKDSLRAARLDRERNELTGDFYGNGDVVGRGGRSL
jgi:hypothetical protein